MSKPNFEVYRGRGRKGLLKISLGDKPLPLSHPWARARFARSCMLHVRLEAIYILGLDRIKTGSGRTIQGISLDKLRRGIYAIVTLYYECYTTTYYARAYFCMPAISIQTSLELYCARARGRTPMHHCAQGWASLSRYLYLEPQPANETSKVLEQGLVQNKFTVGKPRAMGLPTANVSYF